MHYRDPEGVAPTQRQVCVDGDWHTMGLETGVASDGDYRCQLTLSTGSHNYYFKFSDGVNAVTLPVSGTYPGPTVIGDSIFPLLLREEASATLSGSADTDYFRVQVEAGKHLVVNLDGQNCRDFDLYIKCGSSPTTSSYDARAELPNLPTLNASRARFRSHFSQSDPGTRVQTQRREEPLLHTLQDRPAFHIRAGFQCCQEAFVTKRALSSPPRPLVLNLEECSITLINAANAILFEERAHEKRRVVSKLFVYRSDSSIILDEERIGANQHIHSHKHT